MIRLKRRSGAARVPLLHALGLLAFAAGLLAWGGGAQGAPAQEREWPTGPQYALALGARPKYPPDFTHFDYANPQAPKGGALTLPADGGFDTLNPFTLKGRPAFLLAPLVFESLTYPALDEPFTEYGLLARTV